MPYDHSSQSLQILDMKLFLIFAAVFFVAVLADEATKAPETEKATEKTVVKRVSILNLTPY